MRMKCLGLIGFEDPGGLVPLGFRLIIPRRTRWKTNSIFLALFSSFFCFSIPIYVGVGESMSGWMNSCEYSFVAGCLHSKVGPQVHLGVQELSAKMDKNFAGLALKLDSYLKEQNAIKHRKSQAEVDFFDGLERRNSALSVAFEDEIKVTEDYVKKSQAFTEQMMSLIKARAKEEDTYLNARNASINNALALTLATSEATTSAERDSKDFLNAMSKTETKYRDANEEIMMKIKSEKASAMEDINSAGKKAAKATARLRADAESFAQKAKDQWADHYSRTEATLREKSDKSSSHVTNLQGKTGVARKIIQSGQSAAEATIENWRRADDKATRKSHETASAQCAVLTDFGSKLRDEIRAAHQTMSKIDETRTK